MNDPASPNSSFKVWLVLPAYNEQENLAPLLDQFQQAMSDARLCYEVIVVDDGSGDDTARIAEQYATKMPLHLERHGVNQGLGATIRDGLRLAATRAGERDVVVTMDADNSHPPGLIPTMLTMIREGNDVVIASRYRPGSHVRGVPWHRNLLSLGARLLFQIVFPIHGVRDYTCGYRAYRVPLLRQALDRYGENFVSEQGFQCMVDILLKLRAMDAIFREAPLVLRYDLKGGVSKMRVARTVFRTLGLLVRRRFRTT